MDIELSPELEAAAVKIQAVHRGRQTRKQVNMLKDTKEKDKREAAAAEAAARPEAPPEDLVSRPPACAVPCALYQHVHI